MSEQPTVRKRTTGAIVSVNGTQNSGAILRKRAITWTWNTVTGQSALATPLVSFVQSARSLCEGDDMRSLALTSPDSPAKRPSDRSLLHGPARPPDVRAPPPPRPLHQLVFGDGAVVHCGTPRFAVLLGEKLDF